MKFWSKKKNRVLLFTTLGSITTATLGSVLLYNSFPSAENSISISSSSKAKPNLIPKDNLDFSNSNNSNSDSNLKDLPKNEAPKPIEPSKPDIVKPITPDKQPEKKPNNPSQPKDDGKTETRTIKISGVDVQAKVKPQADRQYSQYDKDNNIANINPYQNQIVGEIVDVEVTDELRKKNIDSARSGLQNNKVHQAFLSNLWDSNFEKMSNEQLDNFFKYGEPWNWQSILDRYKRILDSPNVVKFLKEDAKKRWQDPSDPVHKYGQNKKYVWLLKNLDYSKFTEAGPGVEENLRKGMTIDPSNAYIDENGKLNSYAFSPAPGYNGVTSRIRRDNMEKRVFGYDSEYSRNPIDIEEGNYPGWTKSDVTNQFNKYGINSGDGIKVYKLKRQNPEQGKLNEGTILEIDASNEKGYLKAKQVIEQLKKDKVEITGYRILRMGDNNSSQKFKDILASLPDEIKQLELWFSARATNTSSLIALENKHIKELAMYTLGNGNLDEWSFNPLSFRKTEWINNVDYNVNWNLRQEKATRITFDTLAFDEIDYDPNDAVDPYKRINLGLRMAYYTRNNEPIFQGGFGPGLKPDHDEKGNSYPTGLNLSRIPQLRSLKGLQFSDIIKTQNGSRKIKRLTLFNNSDTFEISSDELNQAGFDKNIAWNEPMSRAYLYFSNGSTTSKVKIKGKTPLTSEGLRNLQVLFKIADSLNSSRSIAVEDDGVMATLKGNGYSVQKDDGWNPDFT